MIRAGTVARYAHRFICKLCGAESPAGIGYVSSLVGPMPAPAPRCPNPHGRILR